MMAQAKFSNTSQTLTIKTIHLQLEVDRFTKNADSPIPIHWQDRVHKNRPIPMHRSIFGLK